MYRSLKSEVSTSVEIKFLESVYMLKFLKCDIKNSH